MSCFWDGIAQSLTPDELARTGSAPTAVKSWLQRNNKLPRRCRWQGETIREQDLRDMQTWVANDTTPVYAGHDTSTMDPYLCLLCDLLGVNVEHNYNGAVIRYKFAQPDGHAPTARTLRFKSDRGHFWSEST